MFFGHWDQVGQRTTAYQCHRSAGWNPTIWITYIVCSATPPHWRDCWLEDCILQHPGAFLESKFIKPFTKKYLTYAAQSVLTPMLNRKHPLKGLYALILVAVHSSMFSVDIIGNNDSFFLRLSKASLPTKMGHLLCLLHSTRRTIGSHLETSFPTLTRSKKSGRHLSSMSYKDLMKTRWMVTVTLKRTSRWSLHSVSICIFRLVHWKDDSKLFRCHILPYIFPVIFFLSSLFRVQSFKQI